MAILCARAIWPDLTAINNVGNHQCFTRLTKQPNHSHCEWATMQGVNINQKSVGSLLTGAGANS